MYSSLSVLEIRLYFPSRKQILVLISFKKSEGFAHVEEAKFQKLFPWILQAIKSLFTFIFGCLITRF